MSKKESDNIDNSIVEIIKKFFHNDNTLWITSCSAIVSILISSIIYYFQNLTLEEWRVSPDMVGNLAERQSLLHIIYNIWNILHCHALCAIIHSE